MVVEGEEEGIEEDPCVERDGEEAASSDVKRLGEREPRMPNMVVGIMMVLKSAAVNR